jgi:hypothetical protein
MQHKCSTDESSLPTAGSTLGQLRAARTTAQSGKPYSLCPLVTMAEGSMREKRTSKRPAWLLDGVDPSLAEAEG